MFIKKNCSETKKKRIYKLPLIAWRGKSGNPKCIKIVNVNLVYYCLLHFLWNQSAG